MTALAALATDLRDKVARLEGLRQSQALEEHVAARAADLRTVLTSLQVVAAYSTAASSAGILVASHAPGGAAVRLAAERVRAALTAFRSDRAAFDQRVSADLGRRLSEAMRELETTARMTWSHYVAGTLPPAIGPLLEVLRADPRTKGSLEELLHVDGRMRQLAGLPFPSPSELAEYRQLVAKRESIWGSMPMEHDPDVLEFVRAAGQSGAPLQLLTPRVLEWLTEQNLVNDYLVRSKA